MPAFSIQQDLDVAIKNISREQRDALGYLRFTFRIELKDPGAPVDSLLGELIDRGWQMVACPIIVEMKKDIPRHVILPMIHGEPRPLRIQGHMEFRGESRLEGEIRSER